MDRSRSADDYDLPVEIVATGPDTSPLGQGRWEMDRRQFVKHAGIGSLGLGALAASPTALAGLRKGDGHQHFSLVALSGTSAAESGEDHVLVLEGAGSFKAKNRHVDREGGGNFVHVRFTPAFPAGQQLVASGKWEVTRFVSYTSGLPDYGRIRPSILVVTVELRPDGGGGRPLAGTLQVICNVGFAGISTGQPEGYRLNIPAAGLNFDTPLVGLTHISIPEGESSV